MKKFWHEGFVVLTAGLIVPIIIVSVFSRTNRNEIDETGPASFVAQEQQMTVRVIQENGKSVQMDLDTYLTGVLLAEMPAGFDLDALKAQAVVARTYTRKRMTTVSKHNDGDVCISPDCCQAYCSASDYLSRGESAESLNKVRSAVTSTTGQVLIYDGEYIEATYFSCSGGRTEEAAAVWGSDVPYLQSVESPGEESAAYYVDTVTFSRKDFLEKLGFGEDLALSVDTVSYTAGAGVDSIVISGKTFSGIEVRSRLGLRSTAFTISSYDDDVVTVTTRGFGHRVGMSQYGAQAMAKNGATYEEILMHYYNGAKLSEDMWH